MSGLDERNATAAELAAVQEAAWDRTWRHVAAHSPFYREHLRQAGLADLPRLPLAELHRIPPIDKQVLSQASEAFLCVPRREVTDIVTTSGSTGQPLVWMLTEGDLQRLTRNEFLSFGCAGFTADDTVILAVTLDRCFMAGLAYFLGLKARGCAVVRVGPSAPAMPLDMIQRARATAIVGVPSFLRLVAARAAESGLNLAGLGVRKAVCIGEPVRHEDFTLNASGAAIENAWGARVFSTYGVTELASSLCECEAGCGGHLHPELLYLEALDDDGQPVPDGQVGELTATTLGVEAMPLLRYRTGDCAAIHRAPCRCGRPALRVGPVVGRKSQKLKLKGTTVFPSAFRHAVEAVPGVSAFVLVARRESTLADDVELLVACSGEAGHVLKELKDRCQGGVKVTPRLTAANPAEIEALQMPPGARKRRWFVDLRQE